MDIINPGCIALGRIDAEDLRRRVQPYHVDLLSRWIVNRDALLDSSREHPCPRCEGTTRFRAINLAEGFLFCSNCYAQGRGRHDIFGAIQWLTGCNFRESLEIVRDFLDGSPSTAPAAQPVTPVPKSAPRKSRKRIIESIAHRDSPPRADYSERYAANKPGITADAVQATLHYTARFDDGYSAPQEAIGFPVIGSDYRITGAVVVRADAKPFVPTPRREERKILNIAGTGAGLCLSRPVEEFKAAGTVLLCEGLPDMVAAAGIVQAGVVVATNPHGAGSFHDSEAQMLSGKEVVVCMDSDDAGRHGAELRIRMLRAHGAAKVWRIDLPEIPGIKDLRDWTASGRGWDELAAFAIDVTAENPPSLGVPCKTGESPTSEFPPSSGVSNQKNGASEPEIPPSLGVCNGSEPHFTPLTGVNLRELTYKEEDTIRKSPQSSLQEEGETELRTPKDGGKLDYRRKPLRTDYGPCFKIRSKNVHPEVGDRVVGVSCKKLRCEFCGPHKRHHFGYAISRWPIVYVAIFAASDEKAVKKICDNEIGRHRRETGVGSYVRVYSGLHGCWWVFTNAPVPRAARVDDALALYTSVVNAGNEIRINSSRDLAYDKRPKRESEWTNDEDQLLSYVSIRDLRTTLKSHGVPMERIFRDDSGMLMLVKFAWAALPLWKRMAVEDSILARLSHAQLLGWLTSGERLFDRPAEELPKLAGRQAECDHKDESTWSDDGQGRMVCCHCGGFVGRIRGETELW